MTKITVQEALNGFGVTRDFNEVMTSFSEPVLPEEREALMEEISRHQQKFWERYADFYAYFFPKLPFVPEHITHFVGYTNPQEGEAIVDLGCGYGRIVYRLLEQCQKVSGVIGIDFAGPMLQRARDLEKSFETGKTEWIEHDINKGVPLADSSVNTVISNWGIFYLPIETLKGSVLPDVHRVLKPNGRLVVSTIIKGADLAALRKKMSFWNLLKILPVVRKAVKFAHEIKLLFPSYTPKEVQDLIMHAGFSVVQSELTLLGNSLTVDAQKK